jgi:hypothetical protein
MKIPIFGCRYLSYSIAFLRKIALEHGVRIRMVGGASSIPTREIGGNQMKRGTKRALSTSALAVTLLPGAARAETLLETIIGVIVDGGNSYTWERVELPGTYCGNGSQYKFFMRRTSSPNLLFFFEGGGACWDYDTCSGRAGVLGAANPNGSAATS